MFEARCVAGDVGLAYGPDGERRVRRICVDLPSKSIFAAVDEEVWRKMDWRGRNKVLNSLQTRLVGILGEALQGTIVAWQEAVEEKDNGR